MNKKITTVVLSCLLALLCYKERALVSWQLLLHSVEYLIYEQAAIFRCMYTNRRWREKKIPTKQRKNGAEYQPKW